MIKIKIYTEWLDEIYFAKNKLPDSMYMIAKYDTALRAIEILGYDWKRTEDGKHKIFGGK